MNFYFAPDQDCLSPLMEAVNAAKESILIADYSFSLPVLTQALIAKHQAGVSVRIVLDKSQSSGKSEALEILKLASAGVDYVIGTSDRHQIMHLKVAVIDNTTIVFGSYNFTLAAAAENNILAVDSSAANAQLFAAAIQKAYAWIQTNEPVNDTLELRKDNMSQTQLVHYLEVFVGAFVATVAASGLNWFNMPSDSDLRKVALSACVAGVVAVYQLVVKPGVVALVKPSK